MPSDPTVPAALSRQAPGDASSAAAARQEISSSQPDDEASIAHSVRVDASPSFPVDEHPCQPSSPAGGRGASPPPIWSARYLTKLKVPTPYGRPMKPRLRPLAPMVVKRKRWRNKAPRVPRKLRANIVPHNVDYTVSMTRIWFNAACASPGFLFYALGKIVITLVYGPTSLAETYQW